MIRKALDKVIGLLKESTSMIHIHVVSSQGKLKK